MRNAVTHDNNSAEALEKVFGISQRDQDRMEQFLNHTPESLDLDELRALLWLNNIEERKVDDDGELLPMQGLYEIASPEDLRARFHALQRLVGYVTGLRVRGEVVSAPPTLRIPRAYYGKWKARNYKGGTKESVRGDRALFLRYLRHVVDIYDDAFDPPQGATFA